MPGDPRRRGLDHLIVELQRGLVVGLGLGLVQGPVIPVTVGLVLGLGLGLVPEAEVLVVVGLVLGLVVGLVLGLCLFSRLAKVGSYTGPGMVLSLILVFGPGLGLVQGAVVPVAVGLVRTSGNGVTVPPLVNCFIKIRLLKNSLSSYFIGFRNIKAIEHAWSPFKHFFTRFT